MAAKTLLLASTLVISLQGIAEASTLSLGDKGAEVTTLQKSLKNKGYFTYKNITGYYGSVTRDSVRKFQRAAHLQADGIAGPKTQAALYGSASSKSKSMATLRYGARGSAVSSVQSRLKQLGYYSGNIDGIYKGGTQSAVKKFQRAARLSADGVVGAKTRAALFSSKAVKASPTKVGTIQSSTKPVSRDGRSIVDTAYRFTGVPYRWGGTSSSGFDCSGYVQYVYRAHGITLPRTSSQMYNLGTKVSSPRIGDLVFFTTYAPGPSHVGIYVGGNKFISATTSSGVVVADMNNSYWENRYLGTRRL
ncbi:C40 family peptidase [Aneurinibacillus sp. REN35]|uniref:C40 family peptidase n=1 Tax=Aneurinibacillus sp. REN35 TaxID=3237286 RepID=UPI0035288620